MMPEAPEGIGLPLPSTVFAVVEEIGLVGV